MIKIFKKNKQLFLLHTHGSNIFYLARRGVQILIHGGISHFSKSVIQYLFSVLEFFRYQKWIRKNEPSNEELTQLKEESRNFVYRPKISIITPVWNVDETWLRLCIESVTNQVYENWELCLVDGNSTKSHIKQVLEEYAQKDPRIKIKFLTENKGIAGNSQEAVNLATGEYVGLLDHDDELAPFALFEVVHLLSKNDSYSYVYSDEDKIDDMGIRKNPFFKPDWSPDLLLSVNYLCHFSVIRRELLFEVGGFHEGYDGSQDYDLFLRITEGLSDNQIAHISKILYHWRMIPESASSSTGAKPYAYVAAKKAISDSLRRRKIPFDAVIDGNWLGIYRVKYQFKSNPEVTIIIPTKDNLESLKRCIESVFEKTDHDNYKILIIDNQSECKETEYCYQKLEKNSKITIFRDDKQTDSSALINSAVNQISTPFMVFLHDDTKIITEEWLSAMLEHAQFDDVGAVGGLLIYPDNTIQQTGLIIGNPYIAVYSHQYLRSEQRGYYGRAKIIHNVSAVSAACMMMRTDLFKKIGGFDPYLNNAFYDVDLCLRLRDKGYRIIFTPYTQLYHYESFGRYYQNINKVKKKFRGESTVMHKRWDPVFEKGDPYYNINMRAEKGDFSIKL